MAKQEHLPYVLGSHAPDLTPRELEVIRLVAGGHSNQTTATVLGVTIHAVKYHVANLLRKLEADNRAQVAAAAVRMGLA